ncbi:glycosyltransferase [Pistricoccus aurantiacus]|nr:glycosyltransferase [Pistricoccus aurantiacus]
MPTSSAAKVLFLIDHLDSGGAPIVVRDLILGMHRAGVGVTLVILSDRQRYELPVDVEIVKLPYAASNRFERWQRYASHARQFDAWLDDRQGTFNLVLAHLHHAHQVVVRSRLSEQAWYCLHADPVTGFLGNKRGLGRWLKRRKVRKLYNRKRLVTVSQGMLERLTAHFDVHPRAARAIHNPLDIARIRTLAEDSVNDAPPDYLVFVGRMDQRHKRFDRLLAAYRDSGVGLPLLLVGGGRESERVEALIAEMKLSGNVCMVGPRDNPYPYMKQARALLLSSDSEGFALVLAEALACGTPVVSVDCPSGPAEILGERFKEGLVPLDDTAAFAAAIRRVVSHPPTIPEDSCDRFRLETVVEHYLALAEPAKG